MSKKRKLETDTDDLVKKASQFHDARSENFITKPYKKFADEKFHTMHIRESDDQSFREIFGRILCCHDLCRHKPFKQRVCLA